MYTWISQHELYLEYGCTQVQLQWGPETGQTWVMVALSPTADDLLRERR